MPAYSGPPWRCSPATTLFYHFRCGALSTAPTPNWTYSFTKLFLFQRPSENLTLSERSHLHQTARGAAMVAAGIRPEIIYAHRKTGGLLVTEENQGKLSAEDIAEWEAAIDEYLEKT